MFGRLFAVALVLLPIAATADDTVQQLYNKCTAREEVQRLRCMAYIRGVTAMMIYNAEDNQNSVAKACLPDGGTTGGAAVQAFIKGPRSIPNTGASMIWSG